MEQKVGDIVNVITQKREIVIKYLKKNNFDEEVGIGDRTERTAGGAPKD